MFSRFGGSRDLFAQYAKNHIPRRLRYNYMYFIKKHPVSHLYDYCRYQHLRPKFTYVYIKQRSGIEYACIVRVNDLFGEGRSFNKKTSKALAAEDILRKIMYPRLNDRNKEPERYISQTFSISVVSNSSGEVESCGDSGVYNGMEPYEGCSESPCITMEDNDDEFEELPSHQIPPTSSSQIEIEPYEGCSDSEQPCVTMEDDDSDTIEDLPSHQTPPASSSHIRLRDPYRYMEVEESSDEQEEDTVHIKEEDEEEEQHLNDITVLDQIENFCGGEKSMNRTPPQNCTENDPKKNHPDSVEYLKKCCLEREMPLPVYNQCFQNNGKYFCKCTMLDMTTYGKGETLIEAKTMAASLMTIKMDW